MYSVKFLLPIIHTGQHFKRNRKPGEFRQTNGLVHETIGCIDKLTLLASLYSATKALKMKTIILCGRARSQREVAALTRAMLSC